MFVWLGTSAIYFNEVTTVYVACLSNCICMCVLPACLYAFCIHPWACRRVCVCAPKSNGPSVFGELCFGCVPVDRKVPFGEEWGTVRVEPHTEYHYQYNEWPPLITHQQLTVICLYLFSFLFICFSGIGAVSKCRTLFILHDSVSLFNGITTWTHSIQSWVKYTKSCVWDVERARFNLFLFQTLKINCIFVTQCAKLSPQNFVTTVFNLETICFSNCKTSEITFK